MIAVYTATMDPPSFLHVGHLGASVAGAVYGRKSVLSTPSHPTPRVPFGDVQATYGRQFTRAMRMPVSAFHELVYVLKLLLPPCGAPPEVRTAIAL